MGMATLQANPILPDIANFVAVSRTTRTKVSNWATILTAVKLAKILPAYLTFLKKAVVRNQTDKKHLTTCGTY
jgi:hypothetical protein